MTKKILIDWLVQANDNYGKFWYFRDELSEAPQTEIEFRKQLERLRKDELITMVYDDSDEGQKFIEENK